jgi:hypothetical protein
MELLLWKEILEFLNLLLKIENSIPFIFDLYIYNCLFTYVKFIQTILNLVLFIIIYFIIEIILYTFEIYYIKYITNNK